VNGSWGRDLDPEIAYCFLLSAFFPLSILMPNPLSLISLAAAARGGSIDGMDSRLLVAAGVTMLQRCAPLVRELAAGRGALLLENSPAYLVALAACEGHGAVLLDPHGTAEEIARALGEQHGRVVFTVRRFAGALSEGVARVLLDDLPGHVVFVHGSQRRRVDVGSHFGLEIEGEEESVGSDEEAVVARETTGAPFRSYTHRELLEAARGMVSAAGIEEGNEVSAAVPFHEARGLAYGLLAPLLAGARVVTHPESGGADAPPRQLP
jgi:acyl-CoA synthetase (AMP-forming)/AMP-acid ligase II